MKVFEKNIGAVELNQTHFKTSGGEGDIYVTNGKVYKIYQDVNKVIPEAKINELAALTEPAIIKPQNLLLDTKNKPVGYSMALVPDNYTLCQLFPKAFKTRNNITPDVVSNLVLKLRQGIQHCHDKQVLLVDINELNFLVDTKIKNLFFIDVDSYKTRSFNPTALMESVRDRHTQGFSELTDWFSFAVIALNLFIGIHPYRGNYAPLTNIKDLNDNLDARMRQNISVFNKGVKLPPTVLPFDVIPQAYRDWLYAVLEDGKRIAPPSSLVDNVLSTIAKTVISTASAKFTVDKLLHLKDVISWIDGDFAQAGNALYYKGHQANVPTVSGTVIGYTPQLNRPIAAWVEDRRIKFYDIQHSSMLETEFMADECISFNGSIYFRCMDKFLKVEFFDSNKLLVSSKLVCGVLPLATKLGFGCLIQNVLGKYFVSIIEGTANRQFAIPELSGYLVNEFKYENGILVIAAVNKNGNYKHLIFKIASDNTYNLRIVDNSDALNFITLDNGVCLYQNGDTLEVFNNQLSSTAVMVVQDNFLNQDYRLAHTGTQALAIIANEVFAISMRK